MTLISKVIVFITALVMAHSAFAMHAVAHRETVNQALKLAQQGDEKSRWIYSFYSYHAQRAGTSAHSTIADNGPSPDNFLDTIIGGWWIGYRYFIEVQFQIGGGFTTYWHAVAAFRPGKNGDRYSGFAYPIAPSGGIFGLNSILKTVLYNQEIKSGSYENAKGLVIGLKDIFQIFTGDWLGLAKDMYSGEKAVGDWPVEGAPDVLHNYQTQTASTDPTVNGQFKDGKYRIPESNWDKIQETYFNPATNVGQYWYNQFTHLAEFDEVSENQLNQLGYVMHFVADMATAQHVWSTTDHNHVSFEHHMDVMLEKGYQVDKDKVYSWIEKFYASDMTTLKQTFATGANDTPAGLTEGEIAIKDLKINGKIDPTLYSAGDLLRWMAEETVNFNKVLSDDSEETFDKYAKECLTLAVAGEILMMHKGAADLYKKKQYTRMMNDSGIKPDIWGYGTFTINGVTYNQIR